MFAITLDANAFDTQSPGRVAAARIGQALESRFAGDAAPLVRADSPDPPAIRSVGASGWLAQAAVGAGEFGVFILVGTQLIVVGRSAGSAAAVIANAAVAFISAQAVRAGTLKTGLAFATLARSAATIAFAGCLAATQSGRSILCRRTKIRAAVVTGLNLIRARIRPGVLTGILAGVLTAIVFGCRAATTTPNGQAGNQQQPKKH